MDRMIFLSMTGAKALMQRQDALAHNLANASTDGFRADLTAFRSVPVRQDGTATTRVANLEATAGFDAASGPMRQTGRPLDVAVRGQGWFVVQASDGSEGYTRAGSFEVAADGTLMTPRGLPVLGDGGPIVLPPNATPLVGSDGTITATVAGQAPVQVGRLRLVDPPLQDMRKSADGLFRMADGAPAPDAPEARVAAGVLEGSNVNVVESMIGMIALSRQFEIQMRLMKTAESNDQRATQLLSLR